MIRNLAQFALTPLVICSASTYCLWPALANIGASYFPQSTLVAKNDVGVINNFLLVNKGATETETSPRSGFHIIKEPRGKTPTHQKYVHNHTKYSHELKQYLDTIFLIKVQRIVAVS